MSRYLLAGLMLFVPTLVFAQKDPAPKDGKVTISMTLHPTGAPVPLSKLRLYPGYEDQQPGNRVQGLLKCFMEQDAFFKRVQSDDWQKFLEMPLADLPKDIREKENIHHGLAYGEKYTVMMGYADKGARYSRIEWNEYFDVRNDGFYYLLPEVQKIRSLASALRLRLRGEIKNGEFTRGCETVKTLLGIAQALEQHPTLIGHLVGTAIAAIAVQGLEEMIQQPNCPNLYWALTDLPTPLLSLRMGLGGERILLNASLGELLQADRPINDKELAKVFATSKELLQPGTGTDGPLSPEKVRFALIASDKPRMEAVRKRLIEEGKAPELVKSFPELQLAILDDYFRYTIQRDECFKAMNLPYADARPLLKKSDDMIKASKEKGDILGPSVLPSLTRVKETQARLDQRIAFLRTIEAIRLHAHENKGMFPVKLADLGVPVPNDPVTGKPFDYSVKEGVATLHGTNPSETNPMTNRHFEIRLAK